MPRVNFVKKARKDNPVVKRGESYYWWKFNFGPKIFSETKPRRSQLTRSDFLGQIYEIEDRISDLTVEDDLGNELEELQSELQSLQEETEERLNNMPEQLQDSSSSGMTLQERVDEIENMISDLSNVECDPEDEEYKPEEVLEEIQGISYNGG